jgi:Saxitoxin biosynthesis operon protein SxtJ
MSIFSPSPKLPSERRFGLTFTIALAGLAVFGIIRHRSPTVYMVCAAASIVFALFTLIAPQKLAPLNKLWFRFGELLGKIVSPVVLGVIFFGILAPLSAGLRLFGRDELLLKRRAGKSYWIDRTPTPEIADSFKNQF